MIRPDCGTLYDESAYRASFRCCAWYYSRWFVMSLWGMVMWACAIGVVTGASATYIFGQIALGLSVYLSLWFLADRPLLNPIQAVVALFYWWFGVGPVAVAAWQCLLFSPDAALDTQSSSMAALWVVSAGLLIYGISARLTLQRISRTGSYARFLMPAGLSYRPKVLIIYLSLTGISMVTLMILKHLGVHGQEETSFFGGTKTHIWWVGVIAAVGSIAPFVSSALMAQLAIPWKQISYVVRMLIVIVVVQTVVYAMYGGWKSPLAVLGAYFVCAYVCRRQRAPWLFLFVGALFFIVFITPFVSFGRNVALVSGAEDSAMRREIFTEVLKDPRAFLPTAVEAMDPGSLFRGIFPLAGELTRRNGMFEGEWHGDTIMWGFEILVPRAFKPDKRDTSIGNFFSQTVGADIGSSNRSDMVNNVAISIPFEFVGNYGWFAGVMSFGLIGILWTMLCGWLLSPWRLSNHPLTPFLVLSTMGMEGALGHFLSGLRQLIVPLLFCVVVYRMLRGKI